MRIPVATRRFSDYTPWPYLTETAGQGAIPTESYGNFGLAAGHPVSLRDVIPGLDQRNLELVTITAIRRATGQRP